MALQAPRSAHLAVALGPLLVSWGCAPRPTPAASRERAVSLADARVVRTIDEFGDRKMVEATAALAVTKNPNVRAFAADLVRDYRKLRAREQALGIKLGFSAIKAERAQAFERAVVHDVVELLSHDAGEFDRLFLRRMVKDHAEALGVIEATLLPTARSAELHDSVHKDVGPLVRSYWTRAKDLLAEIERDAGEHEE